MPAISRLENLNHAVRFDPDFDLKVRLRPEAGPYMRRLAGLNVAVLIFISIPPDWNQSSFTRSAMRNFALLALGFCMISSLWAVNGLLVNGTMRLSSLNANFTSLSSKE